MQKRLRQSSTDRRPNTANKPTRTVKDVLTATFNELQTMEGAIPKYPHAHMLHWAIRNPGEFYKVAARLISTEVTGAAPLTVNIVKFGEYSQSEGSKDS